MSFISLRRFQLSSQQVLISLCKQNHSNESGKCSRTYQLVVFSALLQDEIPSAPTVLLKAKLSQSYHEDQFGGPPQNFLRPHGHPCETFLGAPLDPKKEESIRDVMLLLALEMSGFKFGDIISYKTKCKAGIFFKHFAVYVGDVEICDKKVEENVYELSKNYFGCKFSKLELNEEPEVNNYLDDYRNPLTGETYCKGRDKDIINRIMDTYQNCRVYGILHNNCEHLATYVRYGVRVALQLNLTGEDFIFGNDKIDKNHLLEHVRNKSKRLHNHSRD